MNMMVMMMMMMMMMMTSNFFLFLYFFLSVMQEIALDNPSHSFHSNLRLHNDEKFLKEKNKIIK